MGKASTVQQRISLENKGISSPPTFRACGSLIDFVKKGNVTVGKTESDRVAIVRDAQERYIGKRVYVKADPKQKGTVLYLLAKTTRTVMDKAGYGTRNRQRPHPFDAHIEWDDGRRYVLSLGQVALEE